MLSSDVMQPAATFFEPNCPATSGGGWRGDKIRERVSEPFRSMLRGTSIDQHHSSRDARLLI